METTCAGPGDDAGRDPIKALAQSFLERLRRGERPSVDEYAAAHPELAGEIRELLPALERLERDQSVGGEATVPGPAGPRAATLRGVPRQLGDYTILREVGRGAMGVVYEAVQQSLGRQVALKVLRWPEVGSPALLERFQLEARSAAKLHHTNIVPVFGVGESEGVHYYAMQFIEGQGLDAVIGALGRLRDARTESVDCASSSATIAETIARDMLGGPASLTATATVAVAATAIATDGAGEAGTEPADAGPVPPADAPSMLTSGTELAGRTTAATSAESPGWRCKSPTGWPTPTARACCTATSSRRTCWSTPTARSGSPTSAWPRPRAPTGSPAPAISSARCGTWRPSGSRAARTAGATSTRWAPRSTSC